MERTTLQYLDPVTGERYHILFNPPPTQEVRERLVQRPQDSEERVRAKVADFYAHVRNLQEYYESVGIHINADQDPNTVFECIESGLVNYVPKPLIKS